MGYVVSKYIHPVLAINRTDGSCKIQKERLPLVAGRGINNETSLLHWICIVS